MRCTGSDGSSCYLNNLQGIAHVLGCLFGCLLACLLRAIASPPLSTDSEAARTPQALRPTRSYLALLELLARKQTVTFSSSSSLLFCSRKPNHVCPRQLHLPYISGSAHASKHRCRTAKRVRVCPSCGLHGKAVITAFQACRRKAQTGRCGQECVTINKFRGELCSGCVSRRRAGGGRMRR